MFIVIKIMSSKWCRGAFNVDFKNEQSRINQTKISYSFNKLRLKRTMYSDMVHCFSLQTTCGASSAMWYINTPKYLPVSASTNLQWCSNKEWKNGNCVKPRMALSNCISAAYSSTKRNSCHGMFGTRHDCTPEYKWTARVFSSFRQVRLEPSSTNAFKR